MKAKAQVEAKETEVHLNLSLNLDFVSMKGGATGFDGDTDTTVACRALGDS